MGHAAARCLPDGTVELLECPNCRSALESVDDILLCARGHSFDVARQGYVSLLTGAAVTVTGDSAEMLGARAAVLQSGHFEPIASAVTESVRESSGPDAVRVADVGAGTGYYLDRVLNSCPGGLGIGIDVSKAAARRCARAHPRAGAVVADVRRQLPLRDGVLTHALSIFAPRNPAEVRRILADDGAFIVAAPTPRHLAEVVGPLGMVSVDADKPRRLHDSLSGHFDRVDRTLVEYEMTLTHADLAAVVAMGPSAHHVTERQRAERIAALPEPMPVTASVTVARHRCR